MYPYGRPGFSYPRGSDFPRYETGSSDMLYYPYMYNPYPYMYYHPRQPPTRYFDHVRRPPHQMPHQPPRQRFVPLNQPRYPTRFFGPPSRMPHARFRHEFSRNTYSDLPSTRNNHKKSNKNRRVASTSHSSPVHSSTPLAAKSSAELIESTASSVLPVQVPYSDECEDLESTAVDQSEQSVDIQISNLRENLIHQLRNGSLQCLICLSKVYQKDPIWSCVTCFHIYHLTCIKSWADKCRATPIFNTSSVPTNATDQAPPSWRCPSCQTKQIDADGDDQLKYTCFCGRVRNPQYHPARSTVPHGCDEICGKSRGKSFESDEEITQYEQQAICIHPCTDLCHPGPCPPCCASVHLNCPCGRVKSANLCGDPPPLPCGQPCDRKLSESKCASELHSCLYQCHIGLCPPCPWVLQTACFCGVEHSLIKCGSEEARRIYFTPELVEVLRVTLVEFQEKLPTPTLLSSDQVDETVHNQELSELSSNLADLSTREITEVPTLSLPRLYHTPPIVKIPPSFSCSRSCGQALGCGKHFCADRCHEGKCKPCSLDPSRCYTCPCGRVPLSKLVSSGNPHGDRLHCSDAVPVCPNICARPHPVCGHTCPLICHEGPCPPCQLSISVKCCCGRTSKEMTCLQYEETIKNEGSLQIKCGRMCKKNKPCGRHKCKNKCCDLNVHSCEETCGRMLSCQQHQCEEPCHSGPCGTCWRGVINNEVYCSCGYTVLHPPQPCGTGPPECDQPCALQHDCDHPVRHTCHNEPACPPCTVLMTKECPGGHGVQFSLPCFQPVLSCGRVCGNRLPNCSHSCQRPCHQGECTELQSDQQSPVPCKQPCQKPRPDCGHPCGLACHEAEHQNCLQAAANCPKSPGRTGLLPCRAMLNVVCMCGHRKCRQSCHHVQLKISIMSLQSESSNQLTQILEALHSTNLVKQSDSIPILPCDDSCSKAADQAAFKDSEYADTTTWKRNFQLDGQPDIDRQPVFEAPEYTDFLKKYALSNFTFALGIERQLHSMVIQMWETSKLPEAEMPRVVDHHFPPMNKKRRRFVSELVEFYGMDSYVVDPGPNCHVMVLGKRGQLRMPGGSTDHRGSLTNCLQREFTSAALHIREGIRVPKKSNPTLHEVPTTSTTRVSYAQVLKPPHPAR